MNRKDKDFRSENSNRKSSGKKPYKAKDNFSPNRDEKSSAQPETGKKKAYPRQAKKGPTSLPEYDFKKVKTFKKEKFTRKEAVELKENSDLIRLNKYISNAGVCSRRDADKLIEAGEIKVNGQVITELGYKVNKGDTVKHGNKVLKREKMVYVLLNKPKDFITTTNDPEDRRTVMHLVANACDERIYPVGRLDRNTTGLILLTNDGDLAKKLSHPSHEVKKLYQVDVDKPVSDEDFLKIQEGITLEDGVAKVDELAFVTPDNTSLGIQIHIGRNRIVRRIFESLGYVVLKLDRVMYAGLTKVDLPRGNWRYLTEKEVVKLKFLK